MDRNGRKEYELIFSRAFSFENFDHFVRIQRHLFRHSILGYSIAIEKVSNYAILILGSHLPYYIGSKVSFRQIGLRQVGHMDFESQASLGSKPYFPLARPRPVLARPKTDPIHQAASERLPSFSLSRIRGF